MEKLLVESRELLQSKEFCQKIARSFSSSSGRAGKPIVKWTEPKWEGKITAELKGSTVEQIWPLLQDFCNLDKFFPDMDTCYRVEGTPGQPGLVRRCEAKLGWANEKLLAIDPIDHSLSYEVLENTFGLKNYVATLKVLPIMEGNGEPTGCKIEWSFVADKGERWRLEDFVSYIDDCLQFMAKKMEDAVKASI